jgi:voltage-gated potassium channel Kch
MSIFSSFTYHFFRAVWHVRTIILALIALVVTGAAVLAYLEKFAFADTLYFAFVTGMTIGYGDIVMQTPVGRLVALLIGFIGILFTGLLVAVLVHAVRQSYEESEKGG